MSTLSKQIDQLVKEANFSLRPDVEKLIRRAYRNEKRKKAKLALKWILDNATIAAKSNIALCQDTGFPLVFIEAGDKTRLTGSLVAKIKKAIGQSYKDNYLRRSVVSPLKRSFSDSQEVLEHIHFLPNLNKPRITFFPKGFGSENKTKLKMFEPTAKISQIEDFIVESVGEAGPQGCPPFFVGVGIGGTSEHALYLAKRSLIDRVDSPNCNQNLNLLEKRILNKINKLKIGPMGFGGSFTALAVKIKKHPTHIAGLPVGVNISCHALRSASAELVL